MLLFLNVESNVSRLMASVALEPAKGLFLIAESLVS